MKAAKFDMISVEDYLAAEKTSEVKHEYLDGVIYAMAGTSRNHNVISQNVCLALRERLRGGPCQAFMADLKVHIQSQINDIFYYPDIVATCDPSDGDPYIIERPVVIFEVLSDSTERIDRREKFFAYQTIGSLRQYVIVAQDRMIVESHTRDEADGGAWKGKVLDAPGENLALPSLEVTLSIDSIYEGIDFGE